jgi:hypothetical protein
MDRDSIIDTRRFKAVQDEMRDVARRDPDAVRIVTRARLKLIRDQLKEARVGNYVLHSDEPEQRGGSGLHPTPLQYFTASVGF